jgi:hypothetical protein
VQTGIEDPVVAADQFVAAVTRDRTELVVGVRDAAAAICDRHNGGLIEGVLQLAQQAVWLLGIRGRRHVITGPVTEPSPTGRENAFRIKKYIGSSEAREYKLMSCGGDGNSCQDLGVFRDGKGGAWFLGATEPYHVVVFKKAPSTV